MGFDPKEKEYHLRSWEEFCEHLKELNEYRNQQENLCKESQATISSLLFRGQSNHQWSFESTLLRYIDQNQYSAIDYVGKILGLA